MHRAISKTSPYKAVAPIVAFVLSLSAFSVGAQATGAIIEPGPGWNGSLDRPAPVGDNSAAGYDENAIARWDVVPYQDFSGEFNVGTVAFHMNGIDRVEFAVEGGNWTSVSDMTLNPQTGVVEYWATLSAEDFEDGPIEVRAVAYPKIGIPRLLQPLILNANAGKSLPETVAYVSSEGDDERGDGTIEKPYATIQRAVRAISDSQGGDVGGGRILLLPGTYEFGGQPENRDRMSSTRWLTIEPAPGFTKSDVVIVEPEDHDSLRVQKVHIKDVTSSGVAFSSSGPLDDELWLDNMLIRGSDGFSDEYVTAPSSWSEKYITDSIVTGYVNGAQGKLIRDVVVDGIISDAFSSSGMVINSEVRNLNRGNTDAHPDVYQHGSRSPENIILYGLTATDNVTAQGVFADSSSSLRDAAYVNVVIDNQSSGYTPFRSFQLARPVRHVYVKDSSFVGQSVWRDDSNFEAKNLVIEDTVFDNDPGILDGVLYRDSFVRGDGGALVAIGGTIFEPEPEPEPEPELQPPSTPATSSATTTDSEPPPEEEPFLASGSSGGRSGGSSSGSAGISISAAAPHIGTPVTRASDPVIDPVVLANPDANLEERNLSVGMRGEDVQRLQEFLIRADVGPAARMLASSGASGYFGNRTRDALGEYQFYAGIYPPNGFFGPETRALVEVAGTTGLSR